MSGQWRFGVEEWGDGAECRVVEKPITYTGQGYSANPQIYDPEGFRVVGCDEYDVFGDFTAPEGQRESVVRLLLAAPELLEALSSLCAEVESNAAYGNPASVYWESMSAARAVIAKATGAAE